MQCSVAMATKDKMPSKAKQQRHAPYSKQSPSSKGKLPGSNAKTPEDNIPEGDSSSTHKTYPCISARQPYAGLILNGLKTIETRWTPVFEKLQGRTVAIHVAWKDWDGDEWRKILKMDHEDEEIDGFIRDGEKHGRAVVAGLVDVGETWQCPAAGEVKIEQITEWEKCALLRPLHEKFLTKVSNPRWLKRPFKSRGQRGSFEVTVPLECL